MKKNSQQEKPLVSIIMTTMNRKKIILTSINSVISQTYQNWELLVVGDNSSKLDSVKDQFDDPRIKFFNMLIISPGFLICRPQYYLWQV